MLGVVDAVCADDQLTHEERALVIQLAGLLDLGDLEVEGLLAAPQARVTTVVEGVELKPGDLVVLAGMSMDRKRELTALAEARGLVVWPGVKRGVAAAIAQDPGSGSGKARKAREYGIPVVGDGVLRVAVPRGSSGPSVPDLARRLRARHRRLRLDFA